jgi:hypothetical protein
MTVIGPDFPDPEWELFDYVFGEVDCIELGVMTIDFQSPYSSCIINDYILEAADLLATH